MDVIDQGMLSAQLDDAEVLDGNKELDITEYFGNKEMRWYQVASRNAIVDLFSQGYRRVLLKAPTGVGKTITLAFTVNCPELHTALNIPNDRNLRVLFIAHVHRLLTQAERTFALENRVDVIYQSAFSKIPQKVIDDGIDLVIIDEAHHEAMATIQYQLDIIGDYPIIGATATDNRSDGCIIKFQKTVETITRQQAVDMGHLAETRLHSIVDPTGTNKVGIITAVLQQYHQEMQNTMVFMKTHKESQQIYQVIRDLGYPVELIMKQSHREVDTILDRFGSGDIQFIVNCNKINEGVDVANCSHVLLGRQYGSYTQLNQVIGRAARPDSDCNVWELIYPLSSRNLDTTAIVGTPKMHRLLYQRSGVWKQDEFDYTRG